MSAAARQITPADLIPDADYAKARAERRAALLPIKRLRRVHLGPFCTFLFETYETMLFQVQEMLLTEKGGADQVPDELAAYNPLIPQGSELVATVMFEIEDPQRREQALARMGGVEDDFFIQIGDERAAGVPAVVAVKLWPSPVRSGGGRSGREDGREWAGRTRAGPIPCGD